MISSWKISWDVEYINEIVRVDLTDTEEKDLLRGWAGGGTSESLKICYAGLKYCGTCNY